MASKIYYLPFKYSKIAYNIPIWNIIEKQLFEICGVIDYVISQIKRIRKEKGFNQNGLGVDTISQSSLSKIENKVNKLDIDRLSEIAVALGVHITEFFPKPISANQFEEGQKSYGYADKTDIDDLTVEIKKLRADIASLKKEIATIKIKQTVKKK